MAYQPLQVFAVVGARSLVCYDANERQLLCVILKSVIIHYSHDQLIKSEAVTIMKFLDML